MEFQVRTKPSVKKELNKFTKADYYKILAAFTILSKNPFIGKKMRGKYKGCYNHRVWPYRIIYQVYKKELVVLIIRVGHRQGVYK